MAINIQDTVSDNANTQMFRDQPTMVAGQDHKRITRYCNCGTFEIKARYGTEIKKSVGKKKGK